MVKLEFIFILMLNFNAQEIKPANLRLFFKQSQCEQKIPQPQPSTAFQPVRFTTIMAMA